MKKIYSGVNETKKYLSVSLLISHINVWASSSARVCSSFASNSQSYVRSTSLTYGKKFKFKLKLGLSERDQMREIKWLGESLSERD